jgi:hypothetical protein
MTRALDRYVILKKESSVDGIIMEEMLEAAFPVWQFVWQTAGPAEGGESYGNHGGGGRH